MSNGLDDVLAEIGRLKGKVESLDDAAKGITGRVHEMGRYESQLKTSNEAIADLERRMKAVEAVINMSRGAVWIFVKVSATVAAMAAAAAWIWEKMNP